MAIDIVELAEFYDSSLGLITRRLIRRRIRAMWPSVRGQSVLGFGYATPFLRVFSDEAERTIALMPAAQGVMRWPKAEPSRVALTEETALPLADASFERILLIHALEHSEEMRPMLREIWRVLAPEGRLLVIVPHRTSPWAASERTPFGHGQPFSKSQIARLLEDCLFEPGRPQSALFFPPMRSRLVLRSPNSWEGLGGRIWPGFGGVILIEAAKRVYATPALKGRRRVLPGLPAQVPVVAPLKRAATGERRRTRQTDLQKSSAD
jgi:SAM-dependent methyltransferase